MVVAKHPLCVGCYTLLQQTENARLETANDQLRLLLAHQNHLAAEMDWMIGFGPGPQGRRYLQSQPRNTT